MQVQPLHKPLDSPDGPDPDAGAFHLADEGTNHFRVRGRHRDQDLGDVVPLGDGQDLGEGTEHR